MLAFWGQTICIRHVATEAKRFILIKICVMHGRPHAPPPSLAKSANKPKLAVSPLSLHPFGT